MRKEDKPFSSTEVMTLIESFRSDVGVIAEKVDDLSGRMGKVEDRLEAVEFEVRSMKDVIRVAIPDHERRITQLEAKLTQS